MTLAIIKADAAGVIADRRLYLDSARERLVEDGSPDAAFLLASEESLIPQAEVERLALFIADGTVQQRRAEPEAEASPAEGS